MLSHCFSKSVIAFKQLPNTFLINTALTKQEFIKTVNLSKLLRKPPGAPFSSVPQSAFNINLGPRELVQLRVL